MCGNKAGIRGDDKKRWAVKRIKVRRRGEMKVKGVGYKDQENDESSEKKNLSLEEGEGNIKKVWKKGRREWG